MAVIKIKDAAEALKAAGIDVFDNKYVAGDEDFHSLFFSSHSGNDSKGNQIQWEVYEALKVSEPLRRAISHTTAMSGTKNWYEKGLDYSWHYHPEIGLNLTVLTSR